MSHSHSLIETGWFSTERWADKAVQAAAVVFIIDDINLNSNIDMLTKVKIH